MNDMQNPAQFFADEKAAKVRESLLEQAAARESAACLDDYETGDNVEWAEYDLDATAEAMHKVYAVLTATGDPSGRIGDAKEIIVALMTKAANHHGSQVIANKSRPLPARWSAK